MLSFITLRKRPKKRAALIGYKKDFWLKGLDPNELKAEEIALIYQTYQTLMTNGIGYISGAVSTGKRLIQFMDKYSLSTEADFREFVKTNPEIYEDEIIHPNLVELEAFGKKIRKSRFFPCVILPGEFDKICQRVNVAQRLKNVHEKGWTRENFFMAMWSLVFDSFVTYIFMTHGWTYSRGSSEEFGLALKKMAGFSAHSKMKIYLPSTKKKRMTANHAAKALLKASAQLVEREVTCHEQLESLMMLAIAYKHGDGGKALKKFYKGFEHHQAILNFLRQQKVKAILLAEKENLIVKAPSKLLEEKIEAFFDSL